MLGFNCKLKKMARKYLRRQLLFLLIPLLILPAIVLGVRKVQELRRKATDEEKIFRVEITAHDCSLEEIEVGQECQLSAQVYGPDDEPYDQGFEYSWSVSSSNAIGDLTETEGSETSFIARGIGIGELTVIAEPTFAVNMDLISQTLRIVVGKDIGIGICNDSCSGDQDCRPGLICQLLPSEITARCLSEDCPPETIGPILSGGICRRPECPDAEDCQCSAADSSCPEESTYFVGRNICPDDYIETGASDLGICCHKNNPINWRTETVSLEAGDFYLIIDGQRYDFNDGTNISIRSDPGDSAYTTLEVSWEENDREMRVFMYFHADQTLWRMSEIRTYNGQDPGDWFYYPEPSVEALLGEVFGGNVRFSSLEQSWDPRGIIYFNRLELQAFLPSPDPTLTPTLVPTGAQGCSPCPVGQGDRSKGDANCDGVINVLDFSIWRLEYQDKRGDENPGDNWRADFNCNSLVTMADFSIWLYSVNLYSVVTP